MLRAASPPSWACPKGRDLFCFDHRVDVPHFLEHLLVQHTLTEKCCRLHRTAQLHLFPFPLWSDTELDRPLPPTFQPSITPATGLLLIFLFKNVPPFSQGLSRLPGPPVLRILLQSSFTCLLVFACPLPRQSSASLKLSNLFPPSPLHQSDGWHTAGAYWVQACV